MTSSRILFVCAGNTCRSPLAAALASSRLEGVIAESAGTYPGYAVAENSVSLAAELADVDLSQHQPRDVNELELDAYDLVVALDASVAADLEEVPRQPRELIAWDIPDPYGGSIDVYRACAEHICERLEELMR